MTANEAIIINNNNCLSTEGGGMKNDNFNVVFPKEKKGWVIRNNGLCKGVWIPLTPTHSRTLSKGWYKLSLLQVTLLERKTRLNINGLHLSAQSGYTLIWLTTISQFCRIRKDYTEMETGCLRIVKRCHISIR